jgi:recombinational DNA repair protein RecR
MTKEQDQFVEALNEYCLQKNKSDALQIDEVKKLAKRIYVLEEKFKCSCCGRFNDKDKFSVCSSCYGVE